MSLVFELIQLIRDLRSLQMSTSSLYSNNSLLGQDKRILIKQKEIIDAIKKDRNPTLINITDRMRKGEL